MSTCSEISVNVIQGSALSPATYVVNAADLRLNNIINEIIKFSDDTFLVVQAQGFHACQDELEHVS